MESTGIIVLAGGSSDRLGQPKQLLQYEGKTLIERIVETVKQLVEKPVVVLGAYDDLIRARIEQAGVHIVFNREWASGIASSIRTGLQAALDLSPSPDAVVFIVCDQPYISPELVIEMISLHAESGKPIVACSYGNTLGTPVLFDKQYFGELLLLKDKEGAKKIIQGHPESVASISFPMGETDIDTLQDYKALQTK
jgi:molybdenum cofactor cytidylyltransferase